MSVETVEAPAVEAADTQEVTVTADTTATDETPAKQVKAPKEPTRCLCSLYGVEVPAESEDGETTIEEIGCTATTSSKFAPGHDAKLKSLLIKAGSLGRKVYKTVDGQDVEISVADAAGEYGFADKVQSGIDIANKKAADKAARAQAAEVKKQESAEKKEAAAKAKAEAAAARKAEQLANAEAKAAAKKEAQEAKAAAALAAKEAAATAAADTTPVAGSEDAPLF